MYTVHVPVLRSVAALELQLLQLDFASCQMCHFYFSLCAVSCAELKNFGWLNERSIELTH
jgi:hypothetical protein